jgi:hypothetical protein
MCFQGCACSMGLSASPYQVLRPACSLDPLSLHSSKVLFQALKGRKKLVMDLLSFPLSLTETGRTWVFQPKCGRFLPAKLKILPR